MADHVINSLDGSGAIYQPGLASTVNPGDRIIIPSSLGPIAYFYGGPLAGTPEAPIIIQNQGGQVTLRGGFALADCQGVKVSGDGDSNFLEGFSINSNKPLSEFENGAAINLTGFVKNIEVTRVKVQNVGFGVWCKNEPGDDNCNAALRNHLIENINIHHCKFLDIRIEGMYFGSTNVVKNGANVRPLTCSGVPTVIQPPQLGSLKINDNLVDGTGRAGIQVSQASVGLSEILRNTVRNCGREFDDAQGNGINIGAATRVRIQGNAIDHTLVSGITFFGEYGEILDNVISFSGHLDGQYTPWAWGIWLDAKTHEPYTAAKVFLINNQIGRRGMGDGSNASTTAPDLWNDVGFYDEHGGNGSGWDGGNVVRDNTSSVTGAAAKIEIQFGINWSNVGSPPGYNPGSGITSLFAVTPAVVVARQDITFADAGINAENTSIIYEVGNPLKSYVPGRSINAISGFQSGMGYYIVPKMDFNISNLLVPPIPPGSLLTMTKLKAVTKKIMNTKI